MCALDFKRQADKPMRIFEELNRPITYILNDVKETIATLHPSPVLTASVLLSPTQTARSLGLTWRSIPLWSLCV